MWIYISIYTIKEKQALGLKESKEEYMRGFGERKEKGEMILITL